jgi:hypothetical protein
VINSQRFRPPKVGLFKQYLTITRLSLCNTIGKSKPFGLESADNLTIMVSQVSMTKKPFPSVGNGFSSL